MQCEDDSPEEPTVISNVLPKRSSTTPPPPGHHSGGIKRGLSYPTTPPGVKGLSYPTVEREIDLFLDTFKRRSALAMERAQSLQGGVGGLLEVEGMPPPGTLKSPRSSPRIRFHVPRGSTEPVPRRVSVVSDSSEDSAATTPDYRLHHSLPHSLPYVTDKDLPSELLAESLTVRDVRELIRGQYAIITGGKSRDGCPIITFPECPQFPLLSDEEYKKLMIYLTNVPCLQDGDLGFVLIIDRRNDKWTAVKSVIVKIAAYFPGLITSVYVLRPASFLQKAISEVSCKIFRDEFKFQVIVCSSLSELHEHIDREELTEELGGTIVYCHEEWIEQRIALERFSASTQDIGNSLRQFTQQLTAEELPCDISKAQELLASQASEYTSLKNDLLSASKHGESLLACIKRTKSHLPPPTYPLNGGLYPLHLHGGNSNTNPHTEHESKSSNRQSPSDRLSYITAVERLLVQLEETETTFDDFWSQHHQRMTQGLQLRKFEKEYRDVKNEVDTLFQEVSKVPTVYDSVKQLQGRLERLHRISDSVAGALSRCAEVRSAGQQLIACEHYALDSVRPKCGELARRRQDLEDVLTTKQEGLKRCRELQQTVDRANDWCSEGYELLSGQLVDRNSQEYVTTAVRRVDTFLTTSQYNPKAMNTPWEIFSDYEDLMTSDTRSLIQQTIKRMEDVHMKCDKRKNSLKRLSRQFQYQQDRPLMRNGSEGCLVKGSSAPHMDSLSLGGRLSEDNVINCDRLNSNRNKRSLVLKELLDTERIYVTELCSVLKGYKDNMVNPEMQHLIPIQLYGKGDILFGNLEQIYLFHNDVFLRDLENCIDNTELIGLCFVQRKESFHHLYSFYCQNKPPSEELRRQVGDNNHFFVECQRKIGHKLPLGAYLLKPVQRITKYQLLLKDLLQYVDGSDGRAELQEGVDTMLAVLKCLNDSMHQVAITAFPGSLTELGKLLMQGPFNVWLENKRVLRDLRMKPQQRHLFLYEKVLLFTKRSGKDSDKASYQFKCALKMSQIGLTESVRGNKGDLRKFEVWLQGRQEVYTILSPSVEVKESWVREIKRVLLDQFEYLKGENIKQYSARIHKGSSLNGVRQPKSPTAQHRILRQTSSWEVGGNVGILMNNGVGSSLTTSTSNPDACGGINSGIPGSFHSSSICGGSFRGSSRAGSKSSLHNSIDNAEDAMLDEDNNWSSEYSASEEEEDLEAIGGGHDMSSKFLVLADYNAMGPSEVSLREGDLVDLVKVGCAGWWYVRLCACLYEGWAPAAYLERVLKKTKVSTPSLSSQDSANGLHHANSRTSVASLKSDDLACDKWTT